MSGTTDTSQWQVAKMFPPEMVSDRTANDILDAAPITGSLTFTQLCIYIAGPSMGVACFISLGLMFLHATHMSIPAEQTKYLSCSDHALCTIG